MAHTSGPWSVDVDEFNESSAGRAASILSPDRKWFIADVWGDLEESEGVTPVNGFQPHGTAMANARLIAAAPELLQALKDLVGRCNAELADPIDVHEMQRASTVIAKAEGRA